MATAYSVLSKACTAKCGLSCSGGMYSKATPDASESFEKAYESQNILVSFRPYASLIFRPGAGRG